MGNEGIMTANDELHAKQAANPADNARAAEERAAFAEALRGREATYALLARLFRTEVDQETLDALMNMRFPTNTGNAQVDRGYALIVDYLNHADANVLTDLAIDYVRAFIGSGNDGFSAAYPYESVHTSPKRLMMQTARDEVLALYRAAGLDKADAWKEGEDHIALELEYLQVLGARALSAWEAGDAADCERNLVAQRNFLKDHLMAWYPMMAGDMLKFPKTSFYQGLGVLTTGFLANEREFLDAVLGPEDVEGADEGEDENVQGAQRQTAIA